MKYHLIKKIVNTSLIIITLLLVSCVDKYWPEINDEDQSLLVVDGMITTEPGPYEIRLSTSTHLTFSTNNAVSNSHLVLLDDIGNSEVLTETEKGVYVTDADGLQGVIGRSYKLTIDIPSKGQYESDFEKLNAPTGIKDVYAEIEYKATNEYTHDLTGYQFYLNSEPIVGDSTFLVYKQEETYHYQSDYLIKYEWKYDSVLYWNGYYYFRRPKLFTYDMPIRYYNCWNTEMIEDLVSIDVSDKEGKLINKLPLTFVNTETKKLSVRYSLQVQQLSVSQRAYIFWENIKNLDSGEGLMTYTQPFQITGNIKNVNNEDEVVLGYFMVAGISTERIYVDKPPEEVPFYYRGCKLSADDYERFGDVSRSDPITWPLFITTDAEGNYALPVQSCIDCRKRGGTIEKPNFWID